MGRCGCASVEVGRCSIVLPIDSIAAIVVHCRGVAQLVAHQFWELGAGSSSLLTPTIRKNDRL